MRRNKGIKKFRLEPKYTHHRSEGLTKRQSDKYCGKKPRQASTPQ